MNSEDFWSGHKIGNEVGRKEALEKIYDALDLYEFIDRMTKHLED